MTRFCNTAKLAITLFISISSIVKTVSCKKKTFYISRYMKQIWLNYVLIFGLIKNMLNGTSLEP